jgi:EAL domain-containing protein (putative c-di-GMP-specific phosphodiesterase class I)/GGDEF domain-containing protein
LAPPFTGQGSSLAAELKAILAEGRLKAHFQPILDLSTGKIHGFEGLIRGPSDSVLHSPLNLLKVATYAGCRMETEAACCQTLALAFAASGLPQRLFLNVSPESLAHPSFLTCMASEALRQVGLTPDRIVIELTENQPTFAFGVLAETSKRYRDLGFTLAMDDLGEGFSSLRLWSELRPEYVKIDMHFIQGVSRDPVKLQFLRSIRDIAATTGAQVVAEGIESEADLAIIQDLGLDLGQGYLLGRPAPVPHPIPSPKIRRQGPGWRDESQGSAWIRESRSTAARLLVEVSSLPPEAPTHEVEKRFARERELQSIPVVQDGRPVGLINRHAFLDVMARPFARELYSKRSCESLMDACILVVDHLTGLHELSKLIVESDPRHILHGFIITRNGLYAGMGSGHDLMREITQMQINAARYANPLTGLPGNVPINEHLDDLLGQGVPFVACYCDLDHFKPYNDVHGYRRGDDVIHWLGRLLETVCEPDLDFVGHIGGDDFMVVFQARDWERRCQDLLTRFRAGREQFFTADELHQGGYGGEDRQRRAVFHPLLSLSIGAVQAAPGSFPSHHELASAAATAKKEAKRQEGCSLFLDRRSY